MFFFQNVGIYSWPTLGYILGHLQETFLWMIDFLLHEIKRRNCIWMAFRSTKLHLFVVKESSLRWDCNGRDGVSNHRRLDFLLNRLFRRRSTKTSNLRVTGLCEGNPPVTSWLPSQRASNAENVSIWWRHHVWQIRMQIEVMPWICL